MIKTLTQLYYDRLSKIGTATSGRYPKGSGGNEPAGEKGNIGYRAGSPNDYAEGMNQHQGGRNSGHYGSGTYFFSNEDKAKGYAEGVRGTSQINLEGKNLYKPTDAKEGKDLHEFFQTLNDASVRKGHTEWQGDIGYKPDYGLWSSKLGWMGIKVSPDDIKRSMDEVYELAGKGFPKEDTASTRIMRRAGYDGVDVRHIPELDNANYGSVLYRSKK